MKQLQIKNLNKSFYDKHQHRTAGINDITLELSRGEIVAILGTNGAGKSTILNAITGNFYSDSGEIILNGERIDQMSQEKIALKVGRVFQDTNLGIAPRMTVFENLMLAKRKGEKRLFSLSLNNESRQEMQNYLKNFHLNLEHLLDLPIENLSGGQKQVIALIMATLKLPELLLLDEHTAALDPRTGKAVMSLTYQMIQDLNLTTLMVTHQLQDAVDFADRILIMDQGRIVQELVNDKENNLTAARLFQMMQDIVEKNAVKEPSSL